MSNPSLLAPAFPYEQPLQADRSPAVSIAPTDGRAAEPATVDARPSNLSIWLELAAVPALGIAAVLPGTGEAVQAGLGATAWIIVSAAAAVGAILLMGARRP